MRKTLEDIDFTMPLAPASQQAQLKKSDSSSDFSAPANDASSTAVTKSNESVNSNSDSIIDSSICEPAVNTSNTSKKDEEGGIGDGVDYCGEGSKEDKDDDDDDEESDEDHEEWMEKVGLNSKVVVNLQRNSKNAQKDSLFYFDNRPKSTLMFSESGDVQALFNYLLNSKTSMLTSGPLAGVPPTLLAPVSFIGANPQKLRLEQNVIKSVNANGKTFT